MPRNVRNFRVEVRADGIRRPIATGPRGKDGMVDVDIYIRSRGNVERAVTIRTRAFDDGTLYLDVYAPTLENKLLLHIERER